MNINTMHTSFNKIKDQYTTFWNTNPFPTTVATYKLCSGGVWLIATGSLFSRFDDSTSLNYPMIATHLSVITVAQVIFMFACQVANQCSRWEPPRLWRAIKVENRYDSVEVKHTPKDIELIRWERFKEDMENESSNFLNFYPRFIACVIAFFGRCLRGL